MAGRVLSSTTRRAAGVVCAAAALALAGADVVGQVGREWRDYAGSPDSSRFVTATQITRANVKDLQVAWTFPAGQTDFNPVIVRGVVYGRGPDGSFVALDAGTGRQLWTHPGSKTFNVRGINYWESRDGKARRLIFSADNFLQAIDAVTGETVTSFGAAGRVDLRVGLDRDPAAVNQQSRTPGRVFENLLIMGSATNQEYAAAPGDIRAFDVRTGKLVWTFHTVPRPGEFGYDTWPPEAWKTVGGANNWGEQSIDVKRGIIYIPTGSAKYNFYGGHRAGANLFGDCIIALDARTGKRLWHFQTVHHDIWDLDNNSAPQLTTIRQNGRNIDVVAVASKTGYLYVFDRVTGKPIWPIEERPVPQKTTVPGEVLSPTQPFPTAPPPFSRQSFTVDDLNPHILTPDERERFRERILKSRNDGPFTPIGFEDVIHMPGNQGGSNWGSTAANPTDGSVYVIGFNVPTIIRLFKAGETRPGQRGGAPEVVKEGRYVTDGFGLYPTIVKPPYTTLNAYDLNTGTLRWQIGLGDDLRLAAQGITGTGSAATLKGGIIPTATGLLFVTAADRKVHVYDSATGKQISELQLGGNSSGSPSMYEHDGRQYLLVSVSQPPATGARGSLDAIPAVPGPTGIVAYALPRQGSAPAPPTASAPRPTPAPTAGPVSAPPPATVSAPRPVTSVLGPTPAPQRIPAPGPATDQPYAPQAILPGGVVVPIFPAPSPLLKAERLKEPEVYNMTGGVPGRIASIVNIHNPSVEVHRVPASLNTGTAIIVVAGGGHNTLNVGSEGSDFVPFFYNYGINTIILRNRLRRDGYTPQTDAVNDMLQAIKVVRAYAADWGIDPSRIGAIGFSAGAELTAPAAVRYADFDRTQDVAGNVLAKVSSRPDFVGLIYPGPTPFRDGPAVAIPGDAPPSFLASGGVGDARHAEWADEYFSAFLRARIPNLEMHIYGNGRHPGDPLPEGGNMTGGLTDRGGMPLGSWQFRMIDWMRDLGFLGKPGIPTKAARDAATRVANPPGSGAQNGRGAAPPR